MACTDVDVDSVGRKERCAILNGDRGPGLLREFGVGWGSGVGWGDAGACWDYTGAVCGEVDSHVQPRS